MVQEPEGNIRGTAKDVDSIWSSFSTPPCCESAKYVRTIVFVDLSLVGAFLTGDRSRVLSVTDLPGNRSRVSNKIWTFKLRLIMSALNPAFPSTTME